MLGRAWARRHRERACRGQRDALVVERLGPARDPLQGHGIGEADAERGAGAARLRLERRQAAIDGVAIGIAVEGAAADGARQTHGERQCTGDALLGGAGIDEHQAALLQFVEDRREVGLGRGEARARHGGDADISRHSAQQPVEPLEIVLGAERGPKRVGARILALNIRGLHRQRHHHLMSGGARQIDPFGQAVGIGIESQSDAAGEIVDRGLGSGAQRAEAGDDDGDPRPLVGAVEGAGIDPPGLPAVAADHRQGAVGAGLHQRRVGRRQQRLRRRVAWRRRYRRRRQRRDDRRHRR
jgi:hypothetical protein